MKTPEELKRAVRQYREGQEESFKQLYELSYRYLYICIANVIRNEEAVMDMLQETYLEISRSIGQLKQDEDFLGWAAVIAKRKCFDYLKKNTDILLEGGEDEEEYFETIPDDEKFIPESILQDREKRKLIREIIDGLSDMQRLCVIAYYYNEEKQEQIAEELQIPLGTVKSHLNRAKAKIKDEIIEMEEKKGTRLYSLAPALLLLFTREAEDCQVKPMPDSLREAVGADDSDSGTSDEKSNVKAGSSDAGELIKAGLGIKIGIGAAIAAVVIGAIAAIRMSGNQASDLADEEGTTETEQIIAAETSEENVGEVPNESAGDSEQNTVEPEEVETEFAELPISGKYDSFGYARDGMVVVGKDDMWGLVTYDDEVIVPLEYTYAGGMPNDDGQTVFGNSDGYKVFDKDGSVIYETEQPIKTVSDDVVLIVESDREAGTYYYRYETMDGAVLNEPEWPGYYGQMGAVGFNEGYALAENGNTDICLMKDGSYQSLMEARAAYEDSRTAEDSATDNGTNWEASGIGGNQGSIMAYPIGLYHNGYFVSAGMNFPDTYGNYHILNTDGTEEYDFRMRDLYAYAGYRFNESDVSWRIDSYNVNGSYCYSYGTIMSIALTEGDTTTCYLLDLAKLEWEEVDITTLSFEDIELYGDRRMIVTDDALLTTGRRIDISDSKYWLYSKDDQWGYIDHDGNEMEMFDDATEFVNGKAMVIKEGKAYFIDENLQCGDEGIPADSVIAYGEMFVVTDGDRQFCLSAGDR